MGETQEIIDASEKLLLKAFNGFKEFQEAEGEAKVHALMDVPTYARASTRTLHKLKKYDDDWEDWWDERQEALKSDPVCSYMWELRNNILKEGETDVSPEVTVDHLNTADIPQPSWADGTFIGGPYGGNGFIVEGPDGTETRVYADLDLEGVESNLVFSDLRNEFDENKYPVSNVEEALRYYLRIIREIVSDAKSKWGE